MFLSVIVGAAAKMRFGCIIDQKWMQGPDADAGAGPVICDLPCRAPFGFSSGRMEAISGQTIPQRWGRKQCTVKYRPAAQCNALQGIIQYGQSLLDEKVMCA